jgi:2-oxo-4-hydroxy-4-carboxy-5-ureidoimidazoline decarboxylase
MANVAQINKLDEAEASAQFLRCCGSTRWAAAMTARRPFAHEAALHAAAQEVFHTLDRADWLQAFAAHPKIGDLDSLRARFAATASWSAREQAGVVGADEAVLRALVDGNRKYEAKFGHIFIVCATGKSAAKMLTLLERRLNNQPDEELAIAAREQEKITQLRLEKL